MSQKLICDICTEPITDVMKYFSIRIVNQRATDESENTKDICFVCYESPVILSEMRRTRTRKPKPKIGRPRGRKKTEEFAASGSVLGAPLALTEEQIAEVDGRR